MNEYQTFPDVARRNLMQEHLEVPALIHGLRLPHGARVLEVGCGRGIALPVLERMCTPSRLVGIDIDAALIARARDYLASRACHAEVQVGDVRELPFDDHTFDLVIDFGTCYHVDHAADALCEVERVLTPGGLFIHETPLSQLLSHPVRTRGRSLPWHAAPKLTPLRTAGLWSTRARLAV